MFSAKSPYYLSISVLRHVPTLWLCNSGNILRSLTQQQALLLGFNPGLLLGGPAAPPNSSKKFSFFLRIFVFNHVVPVPRTIWSHHRAVYRKGSATKCWSGKMHFPLQGISWFRKLTFKEKNNTTKQRK